MGLEIFLELALEQHLKPIPRNLRVNFRNVSTTVCEVGSRTVSPLLSELLPESLLVKTKLTSLTFSTSYRTTAWIISPFHVLKHYGDGRCKQDLYTQKYAWAFHSSITV